VAVLRIAALAPARLDKSFASSLRLHAALGFSILVHAAILLNGTAPLATVSFAAPPSRELAVSLAASASAAPAAPMRLSPLALTRQLRRQTPPAARAPQLVETSSASSEDTVRDAQAPSPRAASPLASAAPAAGRADLLDAPRARFAPAPDYPDEARWEGREGRVLLRFRVRADGRVGEADVVSSSGHADLDAAAVATLRRWSFSASGDVAPEAWYRHAFRFALR
jgi:TonB family protein